MKIDRIKLSAEFHTPMGNGLWLGLEGGLEEGETPEAAWDSILGTIKGWVSTRIEGAEIGVIERETISIEEDENTKLFDQAKAHMNTFQYKEDAQMYLEISGFKHNMDLKNIVNSKPSKND